MDLGGAYFTFTYDRCDLKLTTLYESSTEETLLRDFQVTLNIRLQIK